MFLDVLKGFPNPFSLIKSTRASLNTWSMEPFECKCFHMQDMHWWHIHISVQMKIKMCVILLVKLYKCKWASGLMGVSCLWTSPLSLHDYRTDSYTICTTKLFFFIIKYYAPFKWQWTTFLEQEKFDRLILRNRIFGIIIILEELVHAASPLCIN